MKYIGRTHLNPLQRWRKDGNGYDVNNVFGQAIVKFGWENFTHEILEYGIKGLKKADELERKYIKEMNTIYPNGYNSEDGGVHGTTTPGRVKREPRPLIGWHHSEETKQKMSLSQFNSPLKNKCVKKGNSIRMIALNGEIIKTFKNSATASRETGIDASQILGVCRDITGRHKTAGGYKWEYAE